MPKSRRVLVIYGEDAVGISHQVIMAYTSLLEHAEDSRIVCSENVALEDINGMTASWLRINRYKIAFLTYSESTQCLQEKIAKVDEGGDCYYLVCCCKKSDLFDNVGEFIRENFAVNNDAYWYKHVSSIAIPEDTASYKVVEQIKYFCGICDDVIDSNELKEIHDGLKKYISSYYSAPNKFLINEKNAEEAYSLFNDQWRKITPYRENREDKIRSLYGLALIIYSMSVAHITEKKHSEEIIKKLSEKIKTFDEDLNSRYFFEFKQSLYYWLAVCWHKMGSEYDEKSVEVLKKYILYILSPWGNKSHSSLYAYSFRSTSKRLFESLKKKRLNISSPITFNDPYDCPIFELYNADDEILELLKEALRTTLKMGCFARNVKLPFNKDPKDIQSELIVDAPKQPNSIPEYLNTLMWAHYADSHKGICIKYRFNRNFSITGERVPALLAGFRDVTYSNKNLRRCAKKSSITIDDAFFLKGTQWKYENELRFFYFDLDGNGEHDMVGNTTGCIEAIYFGYKCPDGEKRRIIRLLKKEQLVITDLRNEQITLPIKFYQMEKDDKRFGEFKASELTQADIKNIIKIKRNLKTSDI